MMPPFLHAPNRDRPLSPPIKLGYSPERVSKTEVRPRLRTAEMEVWFSKWIPIRDPLLKPSVNFYGFLKIAHARFRGCDFGRFARSPIKFTVWFNQKKSKGFLHPPSPICEVLRFPKNSAFAVTTSAFSPCSPIEFRVLRNPPKCCWGCSVLRNWRFGGIPPGIFWSSNSITDCN